MKLKPVSVRICFSIRAVDRGGPAVKTVSTIFQWWGADIRLYNENRLERRDGNQSLNKERRHERQTFTLSHLHVFEVNKTRVPDGCRLGLAHTRQHNVWLSGGMSLKALQP